MKSALTFRTIPVAQLTLHQQERMFRLMESGYDAMNRATFDRDLANKHFTGLILDESEEIQGFTTFAINPKNSGSSEYHILFSGDTIIAREHWGSLVMVRGWCTAVGNIISTDRSRPWYWYLMSKGHRTYMYLPLFFHHYYPSIDNDHGHPELFNIIHRVSAILYPDNWVPEKGIIKFDHAIGALCPDFAAGTFKRRTNPHVAFFLERNPGFYQGDELVCLASLDPQNFKRSAREYVLEGLESTVIQ